MNKENCKKDQKSMIKDVNINIKIDKNQSKFITDNGYSPTAIFNEAIKELGYKED